MAPRSVLIAVLLLAGCESAPVAPPVVRTETVTVEVPVAVARTPPAELVQPYQPRRLPEFVPPDDAQASSALTPEGERRLLRLLSDLLARDEAWRVWAQD